mgnify:CR=1 FL=1
MVFTLGNHYRESMSVVLQSDHGSVRVITINRPEARNALSRQLIEALYAALTDAEMGHVEWAARDVLSAARPWDWPIAKRGRASAS